MNTIELLLSRPEDTTLEFKECRRDLNKNVYETVCAFLNRQGGTLLLGVSDSGTVTGIEPDSINQIKKNFITAINNPQKINPACYLSITEVAIDEKLILSIYVPESSQVHRCNGRIYDRNEDGDLDITNHTRMVSSLYHRKQETYSENKIFPYATLNHLREDLIAKARKVAGIQRKDHPWLSMTDQELLQSAQLYQTNLETGKSGVTLAGILLLGKDETILSAVPHHRTDLILRRINLDRYDDRDDVRTNLIESYERIMAFIAKHLPDPFYLEHDQRISIRDAIFHEVASNILIHRDFMNPFPAKLIIEYDQVRTENSNKPHGFGLIDPEHFSPFPKNPVIARFFKKIGRSDELGSGVRNLVKYSKAYGGNEPKLEEGDIFRITIKVPRTESLSVPKSTSENKTLPPAQPESQPESLTERVLVLLKKSRLSKSELVTELGQKSASGQLNKIIRQLLQEKKIEYTIPEKPNSRLQKYRLATKSNH